MGDEQYGGSAFEQDGFIHDSQASQEDLEAQLAEPAPDAKDAAADPAKEPAESKEAKGQPTADPKAKDEGKGKTPAKRLETLQAEINQLTREKHRTAAEKDDAARALATLREEAAELKSEIEEARRLRAGGKKADDPAKPEDAKPKPERKAEPQEDDFEDFRDWVKAHAAWVREEAKLDAIEAAEARGKEAESARESATKEAEEKRAREEFEATRNQLAAKHSARVQAHLKANPGFAKLMEDAGALPTNPAIDEHILHSEMGPALMQYLAEHPDECEAIAALGPGPAIAALGRIEERIDQASKAAKSGSAPKPKPVTRATPPVSPVGGGAEVVDADDDGDAVLDLEFGPEYVRRMNAKDKARRQASRL